MYIFKVHFSFVLLRCCSICYKSFGFDLNFQREKLKKTPSSPFATMFNFMLTIGMQTNNDDYFEYKYLRIGGRGNIDDDVEDMRRGG